MNQSCFSFLFAFSSARRSIGPVAFLVLAGCAAESAGIGEAEDKAIFRKGRTDEYFQASPRVRAVMERSVVGFVERNELRGLLEHGVSELPKHQTLACRATFSDYAACRNLGSSVLRSEYSDRLAEVRERGFCSEQPWGEQRELTSCSGYLIAVFDDTALVQTAGHCIHGQKACDNLSVVFGYYLESAPRAGLPPEAQVRTLVPERDIYACRRLVAHRFDEKFDYAVLELKRTVDSRYAPVELPTYGDLPHEGSAIYNVGHPMRLPSKASYGRVRIARSNELRFMNDANAFPGNSGGLVMDAASDVVWGHHLRSRWNLNVDRPTTVKEYSSDFVVPVFQPACIARREYDIQHETENERGLAWAEYSNFGPVDLCLRGFADQSFCRPVLSALGQACAEKPSLEFCEWQHRSWGAHCANGLDYCDGDVLVRCADGTPTNCADQGLHCTHRDSGYTCASPTVSPNAMACAGYSKEQVVSCDTWQPFDESSL